MIVSGIYSLIWTSSTRPRCGLVWSLPCSAKPSCPRVKEHPGSVHKMFSRFASASRRAARHLSTAAAGDGSGFLIAGGVGVAAIACMAPRADEGHAAAPALPADEASKKLLAVLSHGEELAKIAKVKATMPDNIARRGVETKRRWRADDCDSRAGHPEVQLRVFRHAGPGPTTTPLEMPQDGLGESGLRIGVLCDVAE